MEKKKILILLGCVFFLLFVVGMSYAYWSFTFTQTDNNVVMTDCFEIEFIEGNAINLSKAYPVSDSDGMKNIPYTFTIKNVCEGSATYQINLESLEVSGKKLPEKYLKVDLMERNESQITSKLESNLETEATIEGALSAYQLLVGELDPNEEKEFSLRIWMHSDVTASDKDSMNAEYLGKISVITSYQYKDNRGTLKSTEGTEGILELKEYRSNITKVIIESKMNPKETEISFDLSNHSDGSVMGYLVANGNDGTYTLYLQSEGGIKANPTTEYLFHNYSKLESIEGLEYFDTSEAVTMKGMFYRCNSLISLDVSKFDTSSVTDMSGMFSVCSSLTSLNLSNFDTRNVVAMNGMFYKCSNFTSLDLSRFDTRNVENMYEMFAYCSNLVSIVYGDSFIRKDGVNLGSMFFSCSANHPTHESWNGVNFN